MYGTEELCYFRHAASIGLLSSLNASDHRLTLSLNAMRRGSFSALNIIHDILICVDKRVPSGQINRAASLQFH